MQPQSHALTNSAGRRRLPIKWRILLTSTLTCLVAACSLSGEDAAALSGEAAAPGLSGAPQLDPDFNAAPGPLTPPEIGLGASLLSVGPGQSPRVASSAGQHLVTWVDDRAGRTQVRGARVGLGGAVLDPYGILLLDDATGVVGAAPASNGNAFLVAVERCPTGQPCSIEGVRVNPSGKVVGRFPIATDAYNEGPAAASNGSQYLVAWFHGDHENPAESGLRAARVTQGGAILSTVSLPGWAYPGSLHVVFDGGGYLLTWVEVVPEGAQLRGARFSAQGALLDPAGFAISPPYWPASYAAGLSFDGTSYVAAWAELNEYESYRVKAARVSPGGSVLDPSGIPVGESDWPYLHVDSIAAVSEGGETVLAWSSNSSECYPVPCWQPIQAARLGAGGALVGAPQATLEQGSGVAASSAGPGGAYVTWAWADPMAFTRRIDAHIAGARLSPQGAPLDGPAGVPISTQVNAQEVLDAASDGQQVFVVWSELRDEALGGPGLFGARVTAAGAPLDAGGIRIASGDIREASVAFDGASFVVVWGEYQYDSAGAVRLARVSPGGVLLDASPIDLPLYYEQSPVQEIATASDGASTLVVLSNYLSWPDHALKAVRVGQDGVAGAAHAFALHTRWSTPRPSISYDGSNYLVTWADDVALQGQRLDVTGAPIDAAPIQIAALGQAGRRQEPAVAFGAGHHVAVWHDAGELRAARISPAGQVLDPGGFAVAAADTPASIGGGCAGSYARQPCPAVTFSGGQFVIGWRQASISADPSTINLLGAELSPAGQVLSTFVLSAGKDTEGPPVLASAGGRALAAYTRFLPKAPYSAMRARARLLD